MSTGLRNRFRWLVGLATCMAGHGVQAQLLPQIALDSVRTFHSLERALQQPDSVFRLDLSHKKLKQVPGELRRLKNLNALDLGRNHLKDLPPWMNELQYMQEFSAGRNKFTKVPETVCQWKHLKRLDMHQNRIEGLPKCMGGLKELYSLDLWSNDLEDFPDEISGMKALRFLDLRVIQFSQKEMDRIAQLLPAARIYFSQPCNCGD
ncbi:MAG: leucine-rich repeat domain-containing protein [Bacteroidetes bacterium]|nr:leucine-rich repeat domain-containing protein [Bacteroidota bacterium]MBS1945476.1 leucine-rich repeat domain-containing protein [Bacteroidota bacterium]